MQKNAFQITTFSPESTHMLGLEMGKILPPGTVIALIGDLGCGKTVFVQGLAKGLDVPDDYYVTSPTYTLINEYPGRYPLFHVDLYRLESGADVEEIGLYDIFHDEGIVAIEWADRLHSDDLTEYICLRFEVSGDNSRNIFISACGDASEKIIEKFSYD